MTSTVSLNSQSEEWPKATALNSRDVDLRYELLTYRCGHGESESDMRAAAGLTSDVVTRGATIPSDRCCDVSRRARMTEPEESW